MAPNPIMIPRNQRHSSSTFISVPSVQSSASPSISTPLLATAALVAFVAISQSARRWVLSGCAVESLILLYGSSYNTRILSNIPLWTVLTTLNLAYAVCSTSWLLYAIFSVVLYPCILLTCLFQFSLVADSARKALRRVLKELHFTRDKIAFFNLPALEIDTTVDGLFVVRGITIELSSLTIVVHGVELGK